MNVKVLTPSRLAGQNLAATPAATVVAEQGGVCPAEVAGKGTRIGGRPSVLDRFDDGRWGSWYVHDNSVQAGGNDPGP